MSFQKHSFLMRAAWPLVNLSLFVLVSTSDVEARGKGLLDKVSDTAAQMDPTNPGGAVRSGVEATAKGMKNPLKVVRHVSDVLADLGVEVGNVVSDPVGALNHAIQEMKQETQGLKKSVLELQEQASRLPIVSSPAAISKRISQVKLRKISPPNALSVNLSAPMTTFLAAAGSLGDAGDVIEKFIMKDFPREAKKAGRDFNNAMRKFGGNISREWHSCFNGGCINLGQDEGCAAENNSVAELACYERELAKLKAQRDEMYAKVEHYYGVFKTKINERSEQVNRALEVSSSEPGDNND